MHLWIDLLQQPEPRASQLAIHPRFICTLWPTARIFHIQFDPKWNKFHALANLFVSWNILLTRVDTKFSLLLHCFHFSSSTLFDIYWIVIFLLAEEVQDIFSLERVHQVCFLSGMHRIPPWKKEQQVLLYCNRVFHIIALNELFLPSPKQFSKSTWALYMKNQDDFCTTLQVLAKSSLQELRQLHALKDYFHRYCWLFRSKNLSW